MRRTDLTLVTDIVGYFIDHKKEKVISLTQFCKDLHINSATATKWLEILTFVKSHCPDFYIDIDDSTQNPMVKFQEISYYSPYPNAKNTKTNGFK